MALDFECDGLAIADVDDAGTFPGSLKDVFPSGREFPEDRLRVFVRTVFRPHDRE